MDFEHAIRDPITRCPNCAYELAGLAGADARHLTCPECGSDVDLISPSASTPPQPAATLLVRMCLPFAVLIGAAWLILYVKPMAALSFLVEGAIYGVPVVFVVGFVLPAAIAHGAVHTCSRRRRTWRETRPILLAGLAMNCLMLFTAGWPFLYNLGKYVASC